MIECRNLYKRFNNRIVLDGLSLTVPKGRVTVVIGGSGEGKSVFLKHLVGLFKPDSGQILVDGQDLSRATGAELKAIRERFGVVFQGGALFDSLSVFENVAFPLRYKTREPETAIRERVREMLDHVSLSPEHHHRFPAEISGGMARRVALARALVLNPDIMLFDEPVTGLDPVIKNTIFDLISAVHRRYNFTGVIVSHDIPEIFALADQVAMLHQGKIIAADTPDGFQGSRDPKVRFFLSGGKEKS